MSKSLAEDLLAGATAAAAYTGLTRRVIYHLTESGALPVTKIGRRLYFRRSELDRVFGRELNGPEPPHYSGKNSSSM